MPQKNGKRKEIYAGTSIATAGVTMNELPKDVQRFLLREAKRQIKSTPDVMRQVLVDFARGGIELAG